MGEIHARIGQYGKALERFKAIVTSYPGYPEVARVRYEIATQLFRMGNYGAALEAANQWLLEYQHHPLKVQTATLLGDAHLALGNGPEAFRWWLKAEKACIQLLKEGTSTRKNQKEKFKDLRTQAILNDRLEGLINVSSTGVLEQIAEYAAHGPYAPLIYHRMACLFLEQNKLEAARKAAISLVRSTREQAWVSKGRSLLERIDRKLSLAKRGIGCLLPVSGPFAAYGMEVLNGIRLGLEVLKEAGEGPEIELVIRDSRGEAESALSGLEELVRKPHIMAVIGPLSSQAAAAVGQRAQARGIPLIAVAQREGLTKIGSMVFRNFLTPSKEVKKLVDAAFRIKGIRRFAVLYPDNPYGRFFWDLFAREAAARGGQVVVAEPYGVGQSDFSPQLKKIARLWAGSAPGAGRGGDGSEQIRALRGFQALFIPDTYQRVVRIAPQLVYHDIQDVLLMGTSLWQSPLLVDLAGNYVQGALFSSGFFKGSGESGVTRFVDRYRSRFGKIPDVLAASGYDTIRVLATVLAKQGTQRRADVQQGLLKVRGFSGVTGTISFDASGEVEKAPFLLTVSHKEIRRYP
jgi:ABC-type branched-subunit amino acid transport system substrate-binding protein